MLIRIISFLLYFILALSSQSSAIDRIVPDSYPTIGSAMSAASSGDRIVVKAGTYNEMVDFNKNNITLTMYSTDMVTITGGSNSRAVRFFGDNNRVEYINIYGGATTQFVIAFASGADNNIVDHCDIKGGTGTDKWVYASGANGVTFTNNTFSGHSVYDGPIFIGSGYGLIFRNNKLDYSSVAPGTATALFLEWMNEEAGTNYCYVEYNYFYNIGAELDKAFMFRETDGTYFRNNVIIIDSDYSTTYSVAQIRGMTDGGDGCDNFYFSNNIFEVNANVQNFILCGDQNVNVKVTNNLVTGSGDMRFFVDCWTGSTSGGSSNIVENNRAVDSAITWVLEDPLYSPCVTVGGWSQANNATGQTIVWKNSGEKPNPFYSLNESLDGGSYSWQPFYDFLQNERFSIPDIGAFEYNVAPAPPGNLL